MTCVSVCVRMCVFMRVRVFAKFKILFELSSIVKHDVFLATEQTAVATNEGEFCRMNYRGGTMTATRGTQEDTQQLFQVTQRNSKDEV